MYIILEVHGRGMRDGRLVITAISPIWTPLPAFLARLAGCNPFILLPRPAAPYKVIPVGMLIHDSAYTSLFTARSSSLPNSRLR
jgi:hypothetical protein